jgi:ATP-dependent Lhr-like helicase
MWSDDGFVIRLPEGTPMPEADVLTPTAGEVKDQVLRQLGNTSLFAAKFRESASRALLLPRRRPGQRTALWQQRKRSADLLAVAARYSTFPMLLETYRECMRDVFDIPALTSILRGIHSGQIRVTHVESRKPSPFASSLLFSYIANYIYEGDAPLAERRAQALSIDQSQLQELLGDTDFRELLDPAALDEVEAQLQLLDPEYRARHADALHDMLLRLGDLAADEVEARSASSESTHWLQQLHDSRRVVRVRIAGKHRFIAVEDAARYRDALGTPLPPGLPEMLLASSTHPLLEIVRRYARTHGPFTVAELSSRYGISAAQLEPPLRELHCTGKVLEGEFRPLGSHREWCDSEVLRLVRRKTLARLRREVEPVEQQVFVRFLTRWQGVVTPRRGMDALLDVIENLQGATLLASDLEREILPTRIAEFRPADLDMLIAAGEVVWVGVERIGERDARIALYLADAFSLLHPALDVPTRLATLSERTRSIYELLQREGALFAAAIHTNSGGGFPGDTNDALWELAWAGLITNDTYHSVRGFLGRNESNRNRGDADARPGSPEFLRRFRSRSKTGATSQGRWSTVESRLRSQAPSPTEWSANLAQQMLVRYGIVMRETAAAESLPGGYSTIYPALKVMEESGWVRRGMFVTGLGASQFAMASAVDLLRSLRVTAETPDAVHLAAADPANPYGAVLPWPRVDGNEPHGMSRSSGASVCIVNGLLAAFLRRRNPSIRVFLPDDEPERSTVASALARLLATVAIRRQTARIGLLIGEINGAPAREHPLARFLQEAGFVETAFGFQMRRLAPPAPASEPETDGDDDEENA